jgi:type II secretory pathway pseudopilin PulG
MLTLLLFMALLVIAAAAVAPSIAFEIRRERDEELVHRGVQYSRAIRNFSKKTGRFPNRLEELRETNGLRFIRKLYKDPITGKDFKPLHMMDIPVPGQAANVNLSNSPADGNSTADNSGPDPANPANPTPLLNPGMTGGITTGGATTTNPYSGFAGNATGSSEGQPGLLIFGVVSTSKAKSIREFDHKKHYNEWLFFYDPRYDSGREIKGPTSLTIPAMPQAPPSRKEESTP